MADRRARDPELLDLLEGCESVAFSGDCWRIVRAGRDVLQGQATAARWDPGTFDVLYSSLEREGALAEIFFHLNRQPVFPSKIQSTLYRITAKTDNTLRLLDMAALEKLGVTAEQYASLSYDRTREIGDAAYFLGFDGIIAPSARWPCQNLVLFVDRLAPDRLSVVESETVDWIAWRKSRQIGF